MANSDKPLPSLDELQRKIDSVHPKSHGDNQEKPTPAQTGTAMRAGMDLLAGVGVGGVIGYYADKAFDTSPILFIVFFFLGFAAGVKNIMRNMNKVD